MQTPQNLSFPKKLCNGATLNLNLKIHSNERALLVTSIFPMAHLNPVLTTAGSGGILGLTKQDQPLLPSYTKVPPRWQRDPAGSPWVCLNAWNFLYQLKHKEKTTHQKLISRDNCTKRCPVPRVAPS